MVKKHVVGGKSALFALALTALLSSLPADNALAEGFPDGKYQFKSLASPNGTYPAGYFTFTINTAARNDDYIANWVKGRLEPITARWYPTMAEFMGVPPDPNHQYARNINFVLTQDGSYAATYFSGHNFTGKITFSVGSVNNNYNSALGYLIHEYEHALQCENDGLISGLNDGMADWIRYCWYEHYSIDDLYTKGKSKKYEGWTSGGYKNCAFFEVLRMRYNAEHPEVTDEWAFAKKVFYALRTSTIKTFCTETFGMSFDALREMWKVNGYLTGVSSPAVLSGRDAASMTSKHILNLGGATKSFCGSLKGGGEPILVNGTIVTNGTMKVYPLEGDSGLWQQRNATYTIAKGASFLVLPSSYGASGQVADQGGQMNLQSGAKLVIDGGYVQADNNRKAGGGSHGHYVGCSSASSAQIDIRNGGAFKSTHLFVSLGENGKATGTLSVTNGTFEVNGQGLRVAPNAGTTGRLFVDAGRISASEITLGHAAAGGLAAVDVKNSTLEVNSIAVLNEPRSGSYFKLAGVTVRPNAEGTLFKGFTSSMPLQVGAGGITVSNAFDMAADAFLSGPGALTKLGNGALTFSGKSLPGGALSVKGGTLRLAGGTALSCSSASFAKGTKLEIVDAGGATSAVSGKLTLAGGSALSFVNPSPAAPAISVGSLSASSSIDVSVSGVAAGTRYALISGVGSVAASVFRLVSCPVPCTLRVQSGTLWLYAGDGFIWTGAGSKNLMSDPKNWLCNIAPTNKADISISVTAATTVVCDIAGFAPRTITFPEGSAAVTVSASKGGTLAAVGAIVNNGSARHVFTLPVPFLADGEPAPVDVRGAIEFRGGVTGTVPVNHTTFYGKYTLSGTSWKLPASIALAENATIVAEGMTLSVNGKQINAGTGSKLAVGTFESNGSAPFGTFAGTLVAGELISPTGSNSTFNNGFTGVLRTGKIFFYSNNNRRTFTFTPSPSADVVMTGSVGVYAKGSNINVGGTTFRSATDWTFNTQRHNYAVNSDRTGHILVNSGIVVDTSDYDKPSASGHTVTVKRDDASENLLSGPGSVTVVGKGRFVFKASSQFTGGLVASSGVTLSIAKDAAPGNGNVSMAKGTTLEIPYATNGAVTVAGKFDVVAGSGSTVNVRFGTDPVAAVSGRIKVLVAKGGFGKGATASAFSLANMTPAGEKAKFSIVSAEGGGQELWVEARSGSVWTGNGSDARWTNAGNWIFGAKPEGGAAAYFMDSSVVKETATFPGAASGGNVYVNAGTSAAPVTFSATGAAANGLSAVSLYVGTTSGGTTTGALWLNGGVYSFSGVSYVGTDASKPALLKLGGGTFSTVASFPNGYLYVRPGSSIVGANATLSAKSLEMNGSAENEGGNWTFDYISVANAASSDASIVLRGGTLTARGYFDIGQNANAVGARVEIVDGMVTNTACYVHLGANCPGVLTVRKGGRYGMTSHKYGLIVGGRAAGTLNVAGGDVFVNGPLNLSYRKGKATVNVTDAGVLTYGYVNFGGGVSGAGGNSEIAVDGGTLRALANNTAFLPANDSIAVTVGTKGCTVDNNGKNVTIAKSVAGKGAVRFIGKGTTKLASGQLYTGDTSVAGGTTLALAVAASTSALAGSLTPEGGATIAVPDGGVSVAGKFVKGSGVSADSPVRVTVGNGGKLAAGSYKVLAASSLPGDDPHTYMVLSNAVPAGHKAVFRKDGNAVFVDVVRVYVWKRSVASGNLSVASNWEGGVVPPAGSHVEVGTDSSATLTCDIAEFAPSCIMFPVGSQKVTIAGSGAVAKVRAIKNYASGVHHVFNVPVSFAEGVLADVSLGSSNYVEFRRGMTAYDVKQTGEGTYYYGQFRYLGANIVRSNRDWVYLPKFSSTTLRLNGMRMEGKGANIDLRAGTKLVVDGSVALVGGAGEMRRPYWRNYGGTFSASGVMTLSGGANGEPCDGNSSGVLAVDGLRNESAGRFYLNTAGSGFSSPWRIGASGLTASNGSGGFVVKPQRPATLNAMANYSISAPIAVSNTLYVGTTCATSSVPRTVTVAAQLSGSGSLAVTGAGTLRLTKDCGLAGGIAVANSATLRVDEGVKSVAGNLSLGAGTAVYIGTPSGVPARLAVADAAFGNGVAVKLGGTIVQRGVYPVLTKTGGGSFTQADLAKLSLDCSAVPKLSGVAHLVLGGTGNDSICISTLRHGVWIGGNGNFGDATKWEDGVVPSAGDALFFNEIASNVKVSAPSSSPAVKYGVATMGGKVVTFSGNIAFAGISDTSKVSVDANATVTLDGDLVFANATSGANNYIVNTVGANGAFVVTGRIVSSADGFGYVLPSVNAGDGVIVAKGLVQNSSNSDNPSFRLARNAGSTTRWAIGRDGITGSKNYWILNNNNHPRAEIRPLDSDFTISAKIGNREKATLVLDTTGRDGLAHTIKLTGGTYREGVNIVKGTGKVVCDYIAPSGNASNKFSVEGTAMLVLKAGSNIGSGKVTVNAGATLLAENAVGGSVTLPALEITAGGTLAVSNGGSAPAVKATSFKVLAGASGAKVWVIIGNGTVGAGTYTVLSAPSITANVGDFLLANVASGCTASFSKSGNSLVVTVASSGGTPKSFVENVNAAPVAALSEAQRRARVLNLDPAKADATGEVTIKAIRVDGTKVEVDVVLERRGAVQKDGVDAPINGVLKLYAVDLATGGQTLVAGAQVDDPTFANGDTATFTFETSVPAGFYKAVIDEE